MSTPLSDARFRPGEKVFSRDPFYHGEIKASWYDDEFCTYRYVVVSVVSQTMMIAFEGQLSLAKGGIIYPESCGKG
jgi:hypothetical protein